MTGFENSLVVKRSQLPGAGKGLFTRTFIPKDTLIAEYKGRITTWKEVKHDEGTNGYIYYVSRNFVIDARTYVKSKARYANDARGLIKLKGITNNSSYFEKDSKVYIKANRDILAGEEILVEYGKEYWDAVRHNIRLSEKEKRERM